MTEREHGRGEGREPLDEEAAWAQIVAGYGEEPADPPDREKPTRSTQPDGSGEDDRSVDADPASAHEDTSPPRGEGEPRGGVATLGRSESDEPKGDRREQSGEDAEGKDSPGSETARGDGPGNDADQPVRTFTVYAAGTGPRDYKLTEPGEEEDHFVPPEPPPLPKLDPAAKLAWLAVLGGPAILFSAVLLQMPINWWMITLGVGGFLGGFGTLVYRLGDDRDDDGFDDPGRGAVV